MLTCAVVAVVVTAAVTLTRSASAPARAEQQLVDIAAHSSTPVYYLGRRYHGYDLEDPTIFSQDSEVGSDTDRSFDVGDRMDVGYGSTCGGFFTSGTCGHLIDMEMTRGRFPLLTDCVQRVPGPRGTVLVREKFGAWDTFVGDVTVRVEEFGSQDMLDLVSALRVAGAEALRPGRRLPPPSTYYRHLIEHRCG